MHRGAEPVHRATKPHKTGRVVKVRYTPDIHSGYTPDIKVRYTPGVPEFIKLAWIH